VATSRRSLTVPASPERVWKVVSDPHHMSRWWPEVVRVEGVEDDCFTHVFTSQRGRTVRADYFVTESERPHRLVWEQELEGTPFERVLGQCVTTLELEPDGEGTLVTLELLQKTRGYNRTGGFMLKRAAGQKLDQALDGLAAICTVD
jgi:uncharacterized protein YndB with AHSA1/START domain